MFERYSRQTILKEIERKGQEKLSKSSVLIVGLGGLGSASSELLTRLGIRKLILIDRDPIEIHNLHRQMLYNEENVGKEKVKVAKRYLEKINSDVEIKTYSEVFNWRNAEKLVKGVDTILDGTDNMETRFLINDVCVKHNIPWIYAACIGTKGFSFNIVPSGPCLRCISPQLPRCGPEDTCENMGILNTLPVLLATRQVTELIKILLNKGFSRKFFVVDLWRDKFELLDVKKSESCKTCVKRKFEFLEDKD